jgi:penicillin-binding protein 1B
VFNRKKEVYLYSERKTKNKFQKIIKITLLSFFVIFISGTIYLYNATSILIDPIKEPTRLFTTGVDFSLDEIISRKSLLEIIKQYHLIRSTQKYPKIGYFYQRNNKFVLRFEDEIIRIYLKNNKVSFLSKNNKTLTKIKLPEVYIGTLTNKEFKDYLYLELDKHPQKLIDMLLSIEDARFYDHEGVDFISLYSAIYDTFFNNKALRGASTITQQLIKNTILTNERTFTRKIQEFFLAFMVELRFDKKTILERYLNTVYFAQDGRRAIHGFALASQYYFNQNVENLSEEKMALLVAMTKGAFAYHPKLKPKQAKKRRDLVLRVWNKSQKVTKWIGNILKRPLKVVKKKKYQHYASSVDLVRKELKENYPNLQNDNLKIHLSLDIKLQHLLQKKVIAKLNDFEQYGPKINKLEMAIIIADEKNSEIKAILGNRFNREAVFNRALNAIRPIGSLIKPIIYLSALSQSEKYNLVTTLNDDKFKKSYLQLSQDDFRVLKNKIWQPKNYDKQQHGNVQLIDSLAKSYNVPTVKLGLEVGLKAVIKTLNQAGLDKEIEYLPSLLLGALSLTPLEILNIYQTLMGDGFIQKSKIIKSIYKNGKLVKAEKTHKNVFNNQPLDAKYLNLLKFAMLETTNTGTAKTLRKDFPNIKIATKTGTSDEYRDSWFVAIGDEYSVVTWIGRDDNKPTFLSGATGAMQVFKSIFKERGFKNLSLDKNAQTLKLSKVSTCEDFVEMPFVMKKNTKQILEKDGWFICL